MGRPTTTITPELFDAILERMSQGETLTSICSEPGMPSTVGVWKYRKRTEGAAELYALAREAQADALAEQALDISDGTGDWGRDRLRVDTRKWFAGAMRPRVYGQRSTLEHEGQVTQFVMQIPATAGSVDEWLESLQSSGAPAPDPKSRS